MIRLFNQHNIRKVTELEGMWDFTMDGSDRAYRLAVPGCIEQHPDFLKARGKGTYTKNIKIEAPCNIRLEFKGVSHTADVYFDGEKIAHHYNAFTPFSAVVKNVAAGMHVLKVEADNRFSGVSALHVPNDYYTYGGITRPVALEELSDVYVKNMHFEPHYTDGAWTADIKVTVVNLSAAEKTVTLSGQLVSDRVEGVAEGTAQEISVIDARHDIRVVDALHDIGTMEKPQGMTDFCGGIVLAPYEERTVNIKASFGDVAAWSGKAPNLYLFKLLLVCDGNVIDDYIDRVGFREVSISGKDIIINGQKIYFKGFNRHEDYASVGCAIPFQLMVQDLDLMQSANANAVRTCHYPNDERFLDLCDERGIYVWEENHARGLSLPQMQNPNFDRQCADCIDEMIDSHFNHPSIVIWGILNECASETVEGREKYARQYAQIRSLDKSRPTTSATRMHHTDLCLDLPDVVSFNMYSGWYADVPVGPTSDAEIEWIYREGGEGKPIIVSEFGAGAMYGYRDRTHCKWSEERQADIIRENLEVYMSDDNITGVFVWQFADCRVTEEEWFATRPRCHNNKGVVDEYRRPKMAYDVVAKMYGKYRNL